MIGLLDELAISEAIFVGSSMGGNHNDAIV